MIPPELEERAAQSGVRVSMMYQCWQGGIKRTACMFFVDHVKGSAPLSGVNVRACESQGLSAQPGKSRFA